MGSRRVSKAQRARTQEWGDYWGDHWNGDDSNCEEEGDDRSRKHGEGGRAWANEEAFVGAAAETSAGLVQQRRRSES